MCDKFLNILNNGINFVSKQFNTIINNIEKFVKEHKNNTNTNTNNTNTNDNNSIILEKIVIDNNNNIKPINNIKTINNSHILNNDNEWDFI
jgi:hypothetical protein